MAMIAMAFAARKKEVSNANQHLRPVDSASPKNRSAVVAQMGKSVARILMLVMAIRYQIFAALR